MITTTGVLVILLAFGLGLIFKRLGYPPLPGYLVAGFVAHGLGLGDIEFISAVADIGLILLLFTIGLKLDLRELAAPQVWAVAGLQIVIAMPLTLLVIVLAGMLFPVMALDDLASAWTLALALSFSSTVFAVKIFEERGESASFHARLAIGILIIQDLIAVAYLVLTSEQQPALWPLSLLLLLLLPARSLLLAVLALTRHGELVLLFGIAVALGAAQLFEAFSLKAGLGALVAGVLLARSERAKELYSNLIALKDLFLVGFFLQIGYYGLPVEHMWFVALALALLIFLRPMIYYLLFVAFNLRVRTSMLASSALFNYSEFGLVVAAWAMASGTLPPEWLTTLALAVSISFLIATPLNTRIHQLYSKYGHLLHRLERQHRIPAEMPADLGDAEIVVLGMGRVGMGAYQYLNALDEGKVIGVDENYQRVQEHQAAGIHCIRGDATDYDFWAHSSVHQCKLILVGLTNHLENLSVLALARDAGYANQLAVIARFPDQPAELEALGCISFNLYGEAGYGFAGHVHQRADLG